MQAPPSTSTASHPAAVEGHHRLPHGVDALSHRNHGKTINATPASTAITTASSLHLSLASPQPRRSSNTSPFLSSCGRPRGESSAPDGWAYPSPVRPRASRCRTTVVGASATDEPPAHIIRDGLTEEAIARPGFLARPGTRRVGRPTSSPSAMARSSPSYWRTGPAATRPPAAAPAEPTGDIRFAPISSGD